MRKIPFTRDCELQHSLDFLEDEDSQTLATSTAKEGLPDHPPALPGHPRISLDDHGILQEFLHDDLFASDLEQLASRLWLMSTQSSTNISPLHHQRVKGREIVITESPRLHLVWYYDRVFIKPIPPYLLSHFFWQKYLLSPNSPLGDCRLKIAKAALGYVRTFALLCRHESDFSIAKQAKLIPKEITWESFSWFIHGFMALADEDVSKRYHYGELRLTRLNFWVKVFLHRSHYEQLHGQYGTYFLSFYGPWLVAFAIISVILSAMQLEIGAEQTSATYIMSATLSEWPSFVSGSRWFSVVSLLLVACALGAFILVLSYMLLDEVIWTVRSTIKKRRTRRQEVSDGE